LLPEEKVMEIRTADSHMLLAKRCEKGLVLYDRKTKKEYLLTWEDMQHPLSK
jgi:hypothetical protein